MTDDVEIFVDVPSQADDTTSALHTSLLNEASYAEHLEPAGGGAEAESVAVQTADDELAAAAAALVEALPVWSCAWLGARLSACWRRPGILFLAVCLPHSAVPWEFQVRSPRKLSRWEPTTRPAVQAWSR